MTTEKYCSVVYEEYLICYPELFNANIHPVYWIHSTHMLFDTRYTLNLERLHNCYDQKEMFCSLYIRCSISTYSIALYVGRNTQKPVLKTYSTSTEQNSPT